MERLTAGPAPRLSCRVAPVDRHQCPCHLHRCIKQEEHSHCSDLVRQGSASRHSILSKETQPPLGIARAEPCSCINVHLCLHRTWTDDVNANIVPTIFERC